MRRSLGEFELIERYFHRNRVRRSEVVLGIGDDAALIRPPAGIDLAVSTDTLVAGVHFPESLDARHVGTRALAVNLSDMAAMGAQPAFATLALTLPSADDAWLEAFSAGFLDHAERYGVQLVGGNLARGPLNITVTVHGWLTCGKGLRRGGARPGDRVYVSGSLGDARLALDVMGGHCRASPAQGDYLLERFCRPTPRIEAGRRLLDVATAAIDVSDGLAADLGHIAASSGVGAVIEAAALPLSAAVRDLLAPETAWRYALGGGDDYELCFTVAEASCDRLAEIEQEVGCAFTCVGRIEAGRGVRVLRPDGTDLSLDGAGYAHF